MDDVVRGQYTAGVVEGREVPGYRDEERVAPESTVETFVALRAWIALAGPRGWAVLMKDDSIRRRPAELAALRATGVKAFCVTNANLSGEEQARRLVAHRYRIVQRCRRPGPFVFEVYAKDVRLLWPPPR